MFIDGKRQSVEPGLPGQMLQRDPLSPLFNDVATDNTTRADPVYTTADSLKDALDKLVADIRSAMAVGNIS